MVKLKKTFFAICMTTLLCASTLSVSATSGQPTIKEMNIAANQAVPVESNDIPNWPEGPVISAASAILMEAETGTILYAKDIHSTHYPASITKILTTLIVSEQCSLDEVVTFSHDAVFGIPRGSNHIAMNEGDTLTIEQCLNAILIRSANEVSYAVAEHIGGTWEGFADMMNARARELGCVDSHFVNPNGLPDEDHYVSAYDMAMIGRAFFANEMLCKITLTPKLVIPKAEEDLIEWNQMKLIPGQTYAYEYLIGCKTGYTNDARSTLVSCAEKDGMKLICVVLQDENPEYYEDTITLFDYGFGNFQKLNVSQTETKYNIDTTGSFYSENDIFGNSQPMLSLNKDSCIILPKDADFADTVSTISYDTENEDQAAIITYTYQGVDVGTASVDLNIAEGNNYTFDSASDETLPGESEDTPAATSSSPKEDLTARENTSPQESAEVSYVFVDIFKVLLWVLGIAAGLCLLIYIILVLKNTQFASRRKRNTRRAWMRDRRRRNIRQTSTRDLSLKRQAQARRARKRRKRKTPNRFRDYDF